MQLHSHLIGIKTTMACVVRVHSRIVITALMPMPLQPTASPHRLALRMGPCKTMEFLRASRTNACGS